MTRTALSTRNCLGSIRIPAAGWEPDEPKCIWIALGRHNMTCFSSSLQVSLYVSDIRGGSYGKSASGSVQRDVLKLEGQSAASGQAGTFFCLYFFTVLSNKQSRGGRKTKTRHFSPPVLITERSQRLKIYHLLVCELSQHSHFYRRVQVRVCLYKWDCYEMVILSNSTSFSPNSIFF